jgi:hypothetical protein
MTAEQWNNILWRVDEFRFMAWFLFITWALGMQITYVRIKRDEE